MKSKPVRKYAQPKYPTRLEVAARPGLLQRHQPPAWRNWPELTGAVGLFLLADTARLAAADSPAKNGKTKAPSQAVAVVAPIFQHGAGRGATGCIVMAPPVFLSEEEALQVIREEMAAKGVQLGTNQTTVAGITLERFQVVAPPVPVTAPTEAANGTKPARPAFEIKQEPFKPDAADPKKKVFIEFLSERDADRWDWERMKQEDKMVISSVHSYDLPKTAAYVAERVEQQATNKLYFGTFYDPLAGTLDPQRALAALLAAGGVGSSNKVVDAKAETSGRGKITMTLSQPLGAVLSEPKAESRRLLRLQVQDFLKWLQAQGAI
ncbi:MAG: hypothetical protein NT154_03815 [Verrucomicrobia bacterium]|nr:hypothetical protein [Verrucomicrobiota bacterium]